MKPNKREEEQKILAEMEKAMQENGQADSRAQLPQKRIGPFKDKTPESIHCRKCGTLMEKGKCPTCGHTIYVPMDEGKKKLVRWIVGGVCLVVFAIVFICSL